MTYLADLLDPIAPDTEDTYAFLNDVSDALVAISTGMINPAITLNSNFNTLGTNGTAPITPSDGNDVEFSANWNVQGAANADYILTPTPYPSNSVIQSASGYYIHLTTSTFTNPFYIYQRQLNTVRQYQKNNLSLNCWINNNTATKVKVLVSINSFYNPSSNLVNGAAIYLQPGLNKVSTTILTQGLSGIAVGANPYTEFRLNILAVAGDGTCDLDIYLIKGEFGTLSTQL